MTTRKNSSKSTEQFWMLSKSMLRSPAFRALISNPTAVRVLFRIQLEYMQHGRKDNGSLPVATEHFAEYGCRREALPTARKLVDALGFAKITRKGNSGGGATRYPTLFRLTDHQTEDGPATNEWRAITEEQAKGIVEDLCRRHTPPKPKRKTTKTQPPKGAEAVPLNPEITDTQRYRTGTVGGKFSGMRKRTFARFHNGNLAGSIMETLKSEKPTKCGKSKGTEPVPPINSSPFTSPKGEAAQAPTPTAPVTRREIAKPKPAKRRQRPVDTKTATPGIRPDVAAQPAQAAQPTAPNGNGNADPAQQMPPAAPPAPTSGPIRKHFRQLPPSELTRPELEIAIRESSGVVSKTFMDELLKCRDDLNAKANGESK